VRKLKQLLYNLLSNAVKFTNEDGRVVLRATRVPREEVGETTGTWSGRSFAAPAGAFEEFLQISVSDNGIGISEEGLERLFKPFTQIDSGLARKFEGTGLGLAMVKLLAELHGGAIAMESAEGKGSVFTVWLPMRPVTEGASTPARQDMRAIDAVIGARTALVVEDDFKSAELIRVQLEAEGFTVLHATSAEDALVLALRQPLSLITLDIMLPDMDGWEFLARIKQTPDLRRIPVVIVSIVADPTKGFSLGAAAVMQKPISRQELFESLADIGMVPPPPGDSLRILVVDDDPVAVELTAERIQGMAGTVLRAYGGHEAIEMARRELPDVIVLDLMMPEVSGFDVVAALRDRPATAAIPILIVTAVRITAEDRARLNGYVTAIIEKGDFGPGQLTDEVRRAMSGRRQVA
jgi:CheY-like chemotaxis protein